VRGEAGMSRIQAGIIALVLAGLSCAGQARGQSDHTAHLIEGAKNERRVVWYTSLNLTESKILFDAFQKKYPYVQPETFRATAETTLNRILTETRAGRWEFDAVGMSQVGTLAHYKVLAPYVSPEAGAYISEFKDPAGYWTGYSSNYYTLGYNTKLVSPNEAPRRWEDLLDPKWKGKISIDREEYAWYAALLEAWGKEKTHRFMEALARQNVQWRKGPVLIAQLMAAGEFPIGVVYVHRIEEMKKNGAPVEWAHTLDPIVVGINGIALSVKPKNPFAARLFIDFLLSKDGQEIIRARGRIPARSDVEPLSPNMSISKLKLKAVPSDIGLRSDYIKDFRRIFGL
jgi:iron(III) transport system substrate-binding protein